MVGVLKVLGFILMLVVLGILGSFIGIFGVSGIDSTADLSRSLLVTTLPALLFGFLVGLAAPKLWLLALLAPWGLVALGFFNYQTFDYNAGMTEVLLFCFLLPLGFALLGGYIGRWATL